MEPMRFHRSGDNHSIIAVTAERYVAVVRPLQAASVCRRRRAAAVMASLVLAFVQSYSPAGANAHPRSWHAVFLPSCNRTYQLAPMPTPPSWPPSFLPSCNRTHQLAPIPTPPSWPPSFLPSCNRTRQLVPMRTPGRGMPCSCLRLHQSPFRLDHWSPLRASMIRYDIVHVYLRSLKN